MFEVDPSADDGRYDALTDKIIGMIEADTAPLQCCIAVMSGLAGLLVSELGQQEGCSLLYRFADEIVELENRPEIGGGHG